jgi:hypothetical protein
LSKGENIVKWIKEQRISWLDHLEKMEEDRMPKKIFNQELEGTKRRGRPRKGWREEVERELQVLGVRRWRGSVIGRNGGTLCDRPKPTAGCSAKGRRRRRSGYVLNVFMDLQNKSISYKADVCLFFSLYPYFIENCWANLILIRNG